MPSTGSSRRRERIGGAATGDRRERTLKDELPKELRQALVRDPGCRDVSHFDFLCGGPVDPDERRAAGRRSQLVQRRALLSRQGSVAGGRTDLDWIRCRRASDPWRDDGAGRRARGWDGGRGAARRHQSGDRRSRLRRARTRRRSLGARHGGEAPYRRLHPPRRHAASRLSTGLFRGELHHGEGRRDSGRSRLDRPGGRPGSGRPSRAAGGSSARHGSVRRRLQAVHATDRSERERRGSGDRFRAPLGGRLDLSRAADARSRSADRLPALASVAAVSRPPAAATTAARAGRASAVTRR